MKTTFVNLRSELTTRKEALESIGCEVFRTRMHCNCKFEFNRRNGIIAIKEDKVIEKVIRCKACSKGGNYGN